MKVLLSLPQARTSLEMDRSFGRDVVIPQVSSKLRVVELGDGPFRLDAGALCQALEREASSPPTVWVVSSESARSECEILLKNSARRSVKRFMPGVSLGEPNVYWVVTVEEFAALARSGQISRGKELAALLTAGQPSLVSALQGLSAGYVLIDEKPRVLAPGTFAWAELAPATSFASISAEVFAGLRKRREESAA